MNPLIIGSRGSPLALAQVALIKSLLPGTPIETTTVPSAKIARKPIASNNRNNTSNFIAQNHLHF